MDGRTWTIEGICKENGKSIGPLVRVTVEADDSLDDFFWDLLQDKAEKLMDEMIDELRGRMTVKAKAAPEIAEATKA